MLFRKLQYRYILIIMRVKIINGVFINIVFILFNFKCIDRAHYAFLNTVFNLRVIWIDSFIP